MVHGVKTINGVLFVRNYEQASKIPKDEVMVTPEELQDYLDLHSQKGE